MAHCFLFFLTLCLKAPSTDARITDPCSLTIPASSWLCLYHCGHGFIVFTPWAQADGFLSHLGQIVVSSLLKEEEGYSLPENAIPVSCFPDS